MKTLSYTEADALSFHLHATLKQRNSVIADLECLEEQVQDCQKVYNTLNEEWKRNEVKKVLGDIESSIAKYKAMIKEIDGVISMAEAELRRLETGERVS